MSRFIHRTYHRTTVSPFGIHYAIGQRLKAKHREQTDGYYRKAQ